MDLTPIWVLEALAVPTVIAAVIFIARSMHREAEERRAER